MKYSSFKGYFIWDTWIFGITEKSVSSSKITKQRYFNSLQKTSVEKKMQGLLNIQTVGKHTAY